MAKNRNNCNLKSELQQEERLLKNVRERLLDQLQRLKVEELALVNYISMSNSCNVTQSSNSTGTYFHNTIQAGTNSETEVDNENINSMPLTDLSEGSASNSLVFVARPEDDEEIEEDED